MNIGILGYNAFTGLGACIHWFKKHLNINSHFVIVSREHHRGNIVNGYLSEKYTEQDLYNYIEIYKPDVIIIFETPFNWNYFEILKKLNIKTVFIPMMDAIILDNFLFYILNADIIICPTYNCYVEYNKKFSNYNKKIKYIPYPIDTDYFKIDTKGPATFLHNQGNGGAHWRKGSDQVYNAFANFKYKEATLHINRQTTLHKLYHLPNNLHNMTIHVEDFEEPIDTYKQGKIYLAPSRFEGLGLPILEAMSCGLPVITTNALPMSAWFDSTYPLLVSCTPIEKIPSGDGLIYNPDINMLINKMEWVYNNLDKGEKIGMKNREIILNKFSWHLLKQEYIKELENV